jgi:hypothetical protein
MTSLLHEALQFHADDLNESAGDCVVYVRGNNRIEVDAAIGESRFEAEGANGATIEIQTRDFIIQQHELDFGDGPTEPERRDKIEQTVNGQTKHFEVLPEHGLPHFRVADGFGISYRIFTKAKKS